MNAFLRGIWSIFGWMDSYSGLSPKERTDRILDDFYMEHPWIERDDIKALENDWRNIANDQSNCV